MAQAQQIKFLLFNKTIYDIEYICTWYITYSVSLIYKKIKEFQTNTLLVTTIFSTAQALMFMYNIVKTKLVYTFPLFKDCLCYKKNGHDCRYRRLTHDLNNKQSNTNKAIEKCWNCFYFPFFQTPQTFFFQTPQTVFITTVKDITFLNGIVHPKDTLYNNNKLYLKFVVWLNIPHTTQKQNGI